MKFIKFYYYLFLIYIFIAVADYLLIFFDIFIVGDKLWILALYEFIIFILSIIVLVKLRKINADRTLKIVPIFAIVLWSLVFVGGIAAISFVPEEAISNPKSTLNLILGTIDFVTNVIILIFSILSLKKIKQNKYKSTNNIITSKNNKMKMFKDLTNLGLKRTATQAIGFYLAYFLLILIVGFILGGIGGAFMGDNENAFNIGANLGIVISIIITLILGFLILREKKLLNSYGYILIVLISAAIALFAGALGGLILIAYLTTRQSKDKKDSNEKEEETKKEEHKEEKDKND